MNDVAGNRTRFLLLRRGQRSEHGDVASLAFSLHRNAPGLLLEALACLAERGLNMSGLNRDRPNGSWGNMSFLWMWIFLRIRQRPCRI